MHNPAAKAFCAVLVAYVALTVAVVLRSPLVDVDAAVVTLQLRHHYGQFYEFLHAYVVIGQRGPSTLIALPWFIWLARRRRSARPLVMLAVALVVLNVSVGLAKLATGRLGPRGGHSAYDLWAGGNIYPSGHVGNAVVLYGLITLLVAPRFRLPALMLTALLTLSVGYATLMINTHWLTDVVGGLLAGAVVLCALPWLVPPVERLIARRRARRLWRQLHGFLLAPDPAPATDRVPALNGARPATLAQSGKLTPVSRALSSNSLRATPSSRDALDEPTTFG